ncbi:hypothetical protein [Thalassospira sp.]|uniref:hypothetical protein n=1 Tax=Thalassospira sp. TaxID=1912094 RepID=UPI00311DF100
MSTHKTAKCLTMIAMGLALSGCLLEAKEPVTVTNDSQTLVTPWGAPSGVSRAPATPSGMAAKPQGQDNLVMMEDANRKALDQIQQKQIDEARIALGILDRMAQRCVQEGDSAACATLQTNWGTLSQQLHKTLSMMSGNNMQMPSPGPSGSSAMPAIEDSEPMKPVMDTPPANNTAPSMEKVIPMTQPGVDG